MSPAVWVCALSMACAPAPSVIPLGMGPLAIAERDARAGTPLPAAKAARTAAPEESKPEEATSGSDEKVASDDGDAEKGAAAGDSEKAGDAAFEGLYAGDDVAVFRLPGFPDREQLDDKAKIRIERDSPTRLRIALINSENGSDLCELDANVEGSTAVLDAGQPCFGSEEEGAIVAELSSGKAVLEGERLTLEAEGTLSVVVSDQQLEGELSYSFKGVRQ